MNESFVFYRSFAEAMAELPAEQYKAVMVALSAYALDGTLPEDMDPVAKGFFLLMKPQIDANEKRRESGRKGAGAKWQNDGKAMANDGKAMANRCETMANANANANVNVNVKEKDTKVSQKKSSAFHKPTVDEVRSYCIERRNNVDPERFVDFYESKGWRVGDQSMKDWKAAVRSWEARDKAKPPNSAGIQRGIDYDAVLRQKSAAGVIAMARARDG